nr:putative nucleotidyltransferase, ribonuclease H [Tanacetum cinerariifolium]
IRSFLGLAGYYRRFVEGFSRLALPLTNLIRKGEKFVSNEDREKSFEELKKILVFAPILTLPSSSGGFQFYSDTSKKGLGCVLMQHGYWASLKIEPNLILRIKETQKEDVKLWDVLQKSEKDEQTKFWVDNDGVMWFGDRLLFLVIPLFERAPICWNEVGERVIEGPKLIEVTNKKVNIAKEQLKEARTRQKSYADSHRRELEFNPGDHLFLKVSPCRGVRCFGIKGKLSPRFIGPFEILERVGKVSYRFALPPQLSHVHNVFHIAFKGL